ncbi:MAG: hypothetical protein CMB80_26925 [Flammeovirgaceae bacterium]|nr:hypothetical protein [Flammeovirgaceae bacterium]MBR09638.1 hypothetical protein [Rickettsiales bacterium]
MKRSFRTFYILIGLIIALLLFYTSSFSNVSSPKFSYSIRSTQSVSNQFTTQVGASVFKLMTKAD